jgi:hypothetical protein
MYARRQKTLKRYSNEYICKCWTYQPAQTKLNPLQKIAGTERLAHATR